MSVFGQRGYNKGALVEVAEQAGMTHAGVLHHFGSKEALLVAMLISTLIESNPLMGRPDLVLQSTQPGSLRIVFPSCPH